MNYYKFDCAQNEIKNMCWNILKTMLLLFRSLSPTVKLAANQLIFEKSKWSVIFYKTLTQLVVPTDCRIHSLCYFNGLCINSVGVATVPTDNARTEISGQNHWNKYLTYCGIHLQNTKKQALAASFLLQRNDIVALDSKPLL